MDKLVDYTPEDLAKLFCTASAEAMQIEAAMEPVESIDRDIRILQANEPPAQMSGKAKLGYWFLFFMLFGVIGLPIGFAAGESPIVTGPNSLNIMTIPFCERHKRGMKPLCLTL